MIGDRAPRRVPGEVGGARSEISRALVHTRHGEQLPWGYETVPRRPRLATKHLYLAFVGSDSLDVALTVLLTHVAEVNLRLRTNTLLTPAPPSPTLAPLILAPGVHLAEWGRARRDETSGAPTRSQCHPRPRDPRGGGSPSK